jgi:hypothetical protein
MQLHQNAGFGDLLAPKTNIYNLVFAMERRISAMLLRLVFVFLAFRCLLLLLFFIMAYGSQYLEVLPELGSENMLVVTVFEVVWQVLDADCEVGHLDLLLLELFDVFILPPPDDYDEEDAK